MQIYDTLVATAVAYKLPIINATRELHIKQVVKSQITAVRSLQSWHFERTVWPFANEQRANGDEGLTLKKSALQSLLQWQFDPYKLVKLFFNRWALEMVPAKVKNQTQLQ